MSRDNSLEMINCGIVVLEAAIVVAGSVDRNLETHKSRKTRPGSQRGKEFCQFSATDVMRAKSSFSGCLRFQAHILSYAFVIETW